MSFFVRNPDDGSVSEVDDQPLSEEDDERLPIAFLDFEAARRLINGSPDEAA